MFYTPSHLTLVLNSIVIRIAYALTGKKPFGISMNGHSSFPNFGKDPEFHGFAIARCQKPG